MSIRLITKAYEKDTDTSTQRILVALCDHANDDGVCWPSIPYIAWKLGTSERTVHRWVKKLEAQGAVSIERSPGCANRYHIHLDALPNKPPFKRARKPSTPDIAVSPPTDCHPCHSSVTPTPDTDVTPTPDIAVSPKPSGDPSSEPSGLGDMPHEQKAQAERKPREAHGPAQQIVKAFCDTIGIDRPVNYGKAVGQAQQLAKAGITPENIPDIVRWLQNDSFWAQRGIDLGVVMSQADKWRAAQRKAQPRDGRSTAVREGRLVF